MQSLEGNLMNRWILKVPERPKLESTQSSSLNFLKDLTPLHYTILKMGLISL
jgi:hypothetical protein